MDHKWKGSEEYSQSDFRPGNGIWHSEGTAGLKVANAGFITDRLSLRGACGMIKWSFPPGSLVNGFRVESGN